MLKILTLVTAALVALTIPLDAQESGPQREIIEAEVDGAVIHRVGGEDQIVRIRAKTRHTTVIVLPQTENVLDFVVGDSEYWHLTGAANLAFLKPIAEGVTTNVALVCESGRIYSFLVTEQSAGRPHLVVRIDQEAEDDPRISPGKHEPAFVARGRVAAYQQMAETAIETGRAAQVEADSRIADATALAAGESKAFQAAISYPAQVPLPDSMTRRSIGRSWSRECGMTGSLPTFAPTPRSRPRCTNTRTGNRRWWPTISARTGCISPVTFWATAGCRSANRKHGGASPCRRSRRDRMEAALCKTSRIAPRWRRHSMGCWSYHCWGADVPDLLDLGKQREARAACRSN